MYTYQKRFFPVTLYLLLAGICLSGSCRFSEKRTSVYSTENLVAGAPSLAYQWAEIALKATANDTERFSPRPTITSRYLALVFISMYDAWSRFDTNASAVYLQSVEKKSASERTLRNKETAVSFAAYRTLNEYFLSDSLMFREFMIKSGFDPGNVSMDPATPEGIGNRAAKAVIEARRFDGANQYGDVEGSDGRSYYDYSHYQCVNTADECLDINRWQPKYFSDGKGGKYAPGCLTPFWNAVKPVALKSADQFRPGPPPLVGSKELEDEVHEVVELQANMTNEEKALVEFMRDGPASVQQAGHWLKFAMDVSERDQHNLDEDIKMFMLVEVTAMDAFIACWDAKMHYDFARPFALVHHYYKDKMIKGWGGPDKGIIEMKGQEWRPYSPETFVCPAFPAYVSGHSTVSGGCSEVLKLFTGDDYFGEEVKLVPGALTEINNLGDTVVLKMPTFTATADMAGQSRVLGGYHIQSDNIEGLKLGRKVGREVWEWYRELVGL